MIINNAFSLSMLKGDNLLTVQEVPIELVKNLELVSAIGHADTAVILSGMLEKTIPVNRVSVSLDRGESIVVAQYSGPRLPEGTTILPEGAGFKFLMVTVM
jgi:hypothetical protein